MVPGTAGSLRRSTRMSGERGDAEQRRRAARSCPGDCASACRRGTNAAGTLSMRRPRKSLICVLAIRTAIPFVNPMTTGRGR